MQNLDHPNAKSWSPADRATADNDDVSIARNLVATLGHLRARHAAQQFCWFGVMAQIDRMGPA